MDPEAAIRLWTAVLLVTAVVATARHWRADFGVGLLLAYILSFGILHWLAPALYLVPWYDGLDRALVAPGLQESAYALLSFAVGAAVLLWALGRRPVADEAAPARPIDPRIITVYLTAGVLLYTVLSPVTGSIPTVTALVSTGPTLVVAALGLRCWNAWLKHQRARIWGWLAVSVWLPLVTVIAQGFLGYGCAAALIVFAFVASFYRPRWKVVLCAMLLGYLGLSIYVTYMRDRTEIRDVVWNGAALSDRTARLYTTLAELEWFNLYDDQHLWRIDQRLNQSFLVGSAVAYLEARPGLFARGDTMRDAVLALVPRVLWPDKPVVAGSGDLVSEFTGFRYAEGTSVGIGQVMESYVNFGTPGVVVSFLLLGGLVTLVDRKARAHLERSDAHGFALWFLPGLSLLNIGGSFVETTGTAAAAFVMVILLKQVALRMPDRSPRAMSVNEREHPVTLTTALR